MPVNPVRSDEAVIAGLLGLNPSERSARWRDACIRDPSLRERWPDLARRLDLAAAPLVPPHAIADVLANALRPVPEELEVEGARIGNFLLRQRLGEGGFGVVWLAEQLEPIQRMVALKIVKAGLDTREVIARFDLERQALALMNHPNIARVLDAGATGNGRPYFVMELVHGIAITRYCDEQRLPTRERLRLFLLVCQAVQHAHQKGVIHRDLKPSNILVTRQDGNPVPKVIDFGIAKATDKHLTKTTLITSAHAFVGTPVYTSPEQMEMSGFDVDTRADIYSLGVLLYELLCGRPPFDADALAKAGFEATRKTIRETNPPPPSRRMRTLSDDDRATVGDEHRTDPAKLALQLRGDLDCIVMHCLEKERARRYAAVTDLANDVEHYLAREPVVARPPSTAYRARKFIARHQIGVAAGVAVVLALTSGLVIAATSLVRERAAHERALLAERVQLRLKAESDQAHAVAVVSKARASLQLADRFIHDGNTPAALAHLVHAARLDPSDTLVGARMMSLLLDRNFLMPVGPALKHPGRVVLVSYADRGHAITYALDRSIRFWDLGRGEATNSYELPENGPVALSPDCNRFLFGRRSGFVDVLDSATGRAIREPLKHGNCAIINVAYSVDGRWLISAGSDQSVMVWDATTGETMATIHANGSFLSTSWDGTMLCTIPRPSGGWRTWRLPGGEPIAQGEFLSGRGFGAAFSPDGRYLVMGNSGGAQIVDPQSGAVIGHPLDHEVHQSPRGPVYSHDGSRVVTYAFDGTAKIWAMPTGKLIHTLPHGGPVYQAFFTPDDRFLVTGCDDRAVRLWDANTGELLAAPLRTGEARYFDLSPDGKEVLVAEVNGTVQRWQLDFGGPRPLAVPLGPSSNCVAVHVDAESSNGFALFADHVQHFDWKRGKLVGQPTATPGLITVHPQSVSAVISPSGRFVRADIAGEQQLWDLQSRPIVVHGLGRLRATSTTFSNNEAWMAIVDAERSTLRVWNTRTGDLLCDPITNTRQWAFYPDSNSVVVVSDRETARFDLSTTNGVKSVAPAPIEGQWMVVSDDSRLLAIGNGPEIRFVDAVTYAPSGTPLALESFARSGIFSRNGRLFCAVTPGNVQLWDVVTRRRTVEPLVASNNVTQAAFTADGDRIAIWKRTESAARLFDCSSGLPLAEAKPVAIIAAAPSFLGKGAFLAITPGLSIWSVAGQSLRATAPDWLLRLATVVAGGEVDESGVFRPVPLNASVFDELRHELAAMPDDAPYIEAGRWFLADHTTRAIAPGFEVTAAELQQFTDALNGAPTVAGATRDER